GLWRFVLHGSWADERDTGPDRAAAHDERRGAGAEPQRAARQATRRRARGRREVRARLAILGRRPRAHATTAGPPAQGHDTVNRLTPGPVHRAGLFVLALLIAYVAYDALSDPA